MTTTLFLRERDDREDQWDVVHEATERTVGLIFRDGPENYVATSLVGDGREEALESLNDAEEMLALEYNAAMSEHCDIGGGNDLVRNIYEAGY